MSQIREAETALDSGKAQSSIAEHQITSKMVSLALILRLKISSLINRFEIFFASESARQFPGLRLPQHLAQKQKSHPKVASQGRAVCEGIRAAPDFSHQRKNHACKPSR
ncbi:hypothetical protein [Salinicola halophyticus]|uniref:hypothetical protein n=1 Tax=Salinicola halophyticus TaxID=1808881 RepID=UPI003F4663C3